MKPVLDMCCGSRMFWFDRTNPLVVFCDIREEKHILCDGRACDIQPDVVADFRNLPFENESFNLIVFDPPHLVSVGDESWLKKKYGGLNKDTWQDDLLLGFVEAFRVLKPGGTLIFKWNEMQIKTSEILKLVPYKPMFGHPSGKAAKTHWITFYKE